MKKIVRNSVVIGLLISNLLISCKSSYLNTKTKNMNSNSDSSYRGVLRSNDGISVYSDLVEKDISINDEVGDSSMQDNFMEDGNYHTFDEIETIEADILSRSLKYDIDASFYIPDEFDCFDDESIVTTYDNFINATNESDDIYDLKSKLKEEFDKYIKYKTTDEDEYEPSVNYDVTLLNVFVPGIGSDASCWTNDGSDYRDENEIYIRTNSLPYKITRKYKSKIFVGKPKYYDDNGSEIEQINLISKVRKINKISDLNFAKLDCDDLINGSVILYDDRNRWESTNESYYEGFSCFMNNIVSLYPNVKFNLFGHSRGGDINLLFATDYEDKVENIFSMGTPYYSVELAQISTALDWTIDFFELNFFKEWIDHTPLKHLEAYECLADINEMKEMRHNWNDLNSSTKLHTLGYGFTIDFSIYLKILWFIFRLDFSIPVAWDVLVGTNNAMGLPEEYISFNLFGHQFELYTLTDFDTQIMNAYDRKDIYISSKYIVDSELYYAERKSRPAAPAVPHNLETLYPNTIDTILGWLS